jgi:hypothetical protein
MEGCHPAAPALWQLPGEAPAAPLGADTDAVLAGLDS